MLAYPSPLEHLQCTAPEQKDLQGLSQPAGNEALCHCWDSGETNMACR